eukprot:c11699_g1_i1.p1 GENE.c11699_g1_i1~~c11699_g1_i1.p1  ORF type:complete len:809 (+),score=181.94 c11699_g1_i1:2-2428(+)
MSWWLCIVFNLYLTLVKSIRSTIFLKKYYIFFGYVFSIFIVFCQMYLSNIEYTQGRFSCFVRLQDGAILMTHMFFCLFCGVMLTFRVVHHVVSEQKRLRIRMQKARVFCMKLVLIALCLSSVVVYALSVFSSDPAWTHTDSIPGYVLWRTCRYTEYLSSETPNYSKCDSYIGYTLSLSIGEAIISSTVGIISAFILTLSSDLIIKVSNKIFGDVKESEVHHVPKSRESNSNGKNSPRAGNNNSTNDKTSQTGNSSMNLKINDDDKYGSARVSRNNTIVNKISIRKYVFSHSLSQNKTLRRITNSQSLNSSKMIHEKEANLRKKSWSENSPIQRTNKLPNKSPIAIWAETAVPPMVFDYIIIGGGVAAGYAAREFVNQGIEAGRVAIFSAELVPPYERSKLGLRYFNGPTNLSDVLTCAVGEEKEKTVQTIEWYRLNGIHLHLRTKIESIEPLTLSIRDYKNISYKAIRAIIIATGSSPARLPVTNVVLSQGNNNTYVSQEIFKKSYKNLFYLRTIDDVQRLAHKLDETKGLNESNNVSGKKCLVVGGGYIGLECASVAVRKGWNVTLVVKTQSIIPHIFTLEVSEIFENYLTENGVQIIKGSGCGTLLSDCGGVVGCRLQNGCIIKSDITIVGVGTIPNTEIFKDALQFQSNDPEAPILIDDNFKTTCQGIYAIGDVACPLFRSYGLNQLAHANNARLAGSYVVKHLIKNQSQIGTAFEYHPSVTSFVFDVPWSFYGDNSGPLVKILGGLSTKMLVLWVWQGRVQGALISKGSKLDCEKLSDATKNQKKIDLKVLKEVKSVDEIFLLL